jgi:uroporphyrinogen III methyltransferase/synthase
LPVEKREQQAGPLAGLRIGVTRPEAQAGPLVDGLRKLGAEPVSHPTIRIADPEDPEPLRRALQGLERYSWVVFTSANGVERFWQELEVSGRGGELPGGLATAAIGPATAEALERRGVQARIVPDEYVAEAVAEALAAGGVAGERVLLPRAAGARQVLPERLRAAGAEVDEVEAYRSLPDVQGIAALQELIRAGRVDMVTFTAASTVRCYVEEAGPDLGAARVAVIGPVTARAARAAGVRVDVEAGEYTVAGLLQAICDYYQGRKGERRG